MKINKETGKQEWQYLDKDTWYSIEEELGEVTDFEIKHKSTGMFDTEVHYKSNGEPKIMYLTNHNMKLFIQSLLYCTKEFDILSDKNKSQKSI